MQSFISEPVTRRGFTQHVTGLFACLIPFRFTPAEKAYTFETQPELVTDHPRYKNIYTYGLHNHVTCNGKDILYVTRCVTGPNGVVEAMSYETDKDGRVTFHTEWVDHWNGGRIVPESEMIRRRWAEKRPDPNVPGGISYRFEERMKVIVHRGYVRYWDSRVDKE